MSIEYVSASGQYSYCNTPLSSTTMTMAIWFKQASSSVNSVLATMTDMGSNSYWQYLQTRGGDVGDPVRIEFEGGGGTTADTSGGFTSGSWQHAMGVATASAIHIYINGTNKGSQTGLSKSMTATRLIVGGWGRMATSPGAALCDAKLAHLAIWNTNLGDSEATSLAAGANPLAVSAANLVYYSTLATLATADTQGSLTLTHVGSPTEDTGDNPTVDAPPSSGPAAGILLNHLRTQGIS
jgi:hypothetical protein